MLMKTASVLVLLGNIATINSKVSKDGSTEVTENESASETDKSPLDSDDDSVVRLFTVPKEPGDPRLGYITISSQGGQ